MDNTFSLKILEFYVEIEKMQDDINNKIFNFLNKANELVELSEDDYQIERTLKLNKISLKSYVLDSPCCISLNDNNITDYSIEELKEYLTQYEKIYNDDYSKYFLALSLYELLEEVEIQVDIKISLEIQNLTELIPKVSDIKNINSSEYEPLYLSLKSQLDNYFSSNKIDEKTFNICILILNDIFDFYISGYPDIPEKYLYHDED